MATFFLLWNPAKWIWTEFDDGTVTEQIRTTGGYSEPWTTGTRRQGIESGDRIFLLKVGDEPRGLLAAGVAQSEIELSAPYEEGRDGLVPRIDVLDRRLQISRRPPPLAGQLGFG
ncbi:MAG: hypothetical protein LBR20_03320 [Propionibacteriaceae bacterium]|jgi:5-methylcytosine-specific restriction protein A|nr:hypothetical protein [Propionibacteriaceae bacterium]